MGIELFVGYGNELRLPLYKDDNLKWYRKIPIIRRFPFVRSWMNKTAHAVYGGVGVNSENAHDWEVFFRTMFRDFRTSLEDGTRIAREFNKGKKYIKGPDGEYYKIPESIRKDGKVLFCAAHINDGTGYKTKIMKAIQKGFRPMAVEGTKFPINQEIDNIFKKKGITVVLGDDSHHKKCQNLAGSIIHKRITKPSDVVDAVEEGLVSSYEVEGHELKKKILYKLKFINPLYAVKLFFLKPQGWIPFWKFSKNAKPSEQYELLEKVPAPKKKEKVELFSPNFCMKRIQVYNWISQSQDYVYNKYDIKNASGSA